MENSLRDQILTYLDHWLEPNHAAGIITAYPSIYQDISDCLLTGDKELILETCFFLRQVVLVERDETAVQFSKGLSDSPIVPALEWLILNHPQHMIREQTSITLGKLCLYDRVGTLIECFYRYLDTDPLLLDGLMFEIQWLQQASATPEQLACLEAAATSWNYLTRWAVVHILDRSIHGQLTLPHVSDLLERLAQDDMAAIRAEAEFVQLKLAMLSRIYSEGVSKKERRVMGKQINQAEPALTFENLTLRFWSPLRGGNSYDYHLMELMRFADNLIANQ